MTAGDGEVAWGAERSVLATPAGNPRMVAKALAGEADVAFLDLEDAVAAEQKGEARRAAIGAVRDGDWRGKPRVVRINGPGSPFCYRDLVELGEEAGERLDRLVVPKVDDPGDVHFVDRLLGQIEAGRGIRRRIGLEVQIESAAGLASCEAIAGASSRIEALVFGPGDYAASVGMPQAAIGVADGWDEGVGDRFGYAKQRLLVAARAAGVRAIDGPYADFRDLEGFRRACRSARGYGYDGIWCIHPGQIATANDVFSASGAEVAWAERVLAAAAEAEAAGRGALAVDGLMVDAASVRLARTALARRAGGGPGAAA